MMMRFIHNFKQTVLEYPSPTIALFLATLCLLLGLSTGFWLLFRLFYIIIIAIPLLYLWTRSMINSLEVEIVRETQHATQGKSIRGHITLRSNSILPKIWLELSDKSTIPSHTSKRAITLSSKGTTIWSYNTRALLRGVYTLGPLTVTATDPFGFFKFSKTFGSESTLLIYPYTPEISYFNTPSSNLPGEGHFRKRSHNITPNIFGLRDYASGDSFNRIHWPSTAKKGRMIVKEFEIDPSSELVLDAFGNWLSNNPDLKIEIQGHTDDVGAEEDNYALSKDRAFTVMEYLSSTGVESSRMQFKGFGENAPKYDNNSPDNRAKNRRTDFLIL